VTSRVEGAARREGSRVPFNGQGATGAITGEVGSLNSTSQGFGAWFGCEVQVGHQSSNPISRSCVSIQGNGERLFPERFLVMTARLQPPVASTRLNVYPPPTTESPTHRSLKVRALRLPLGHVWDSSSSPGDISGGTMHVTGRS
jgi:hypothetical protein